MTSPVAAPTEGPWPTEIVSTTFGPIEAVKGDLITRQLRRFGAHQRNELAMLSSFLRGGDHVLDIGAHIGTFTVPLARRVGAEGRVDAFEALPQHVDILRRNTSADDLRQVHVHHALLGNGDDLALTPSVRPGNSAETRYTSAAEGSEPDPAASPPASWTLDDWWHRHGGTVRLIKIDVEGMELDVLRGGESLLAGCRPMLYLEIHRRHLAQRRIPVAAIETLLQRHGYHVFRNLGRRNGRSDRFVLGRHRRLRHGGPFFDILAIPADSDRYPKSFMPSTVSRLWVALRGALGKARRRLRKGSGQ